MLRKYLEIFSFLKKDPPPEPQPEAQKVQLKTPEEIYTLLTEYLSSLSSTIPSVVEWLEKENLEDGQLTWLEQRLEGYPTKISVGELDSEPGFVKSDTKENIDYRLAQRSELLEKDAVVVLFNEMTDVKRAGQLINVSPGGLMFICTDKNLDWRVDTELWVMCTLNQQPANTGKHLLKAKGIIRRISGRKYGLQFLSLDEASKKFFEN